MHEQVVEINRVCLQHHLLVDGPHPLRDLVHRTTPARLERLWRRQFILGPADHTRHAIDRGVGQRQPELLGGPLEQRAGIVGVEDRVIARQADKACIPPQQAGGEPVKCAHLNRLRADEFGDAPTHLVGRLVGERQRHDLFRRNADRDQVRNPLGHHTCFTAAWAC